VPNLLAELKSSEVKEGSNYFKDVQDKVAEPEEDVGDDQENRKWVLGGIFRSFEVLERAENSPVGLSRQVGKVQECLDDHECQEQDDQEN
jgi:hypothetical protein